MLPLFRHITIFACAVLLALPADGALAAASPFAGAAETRWRYDEVTAKLPREQAAIASVAQARINIALHHARRLTEQRLCAGNWSPRGSIHRQQGPLLVRQADFNAGPNDNVWFFQTLREPVRLACNGVSRARYFMEMSRHLPAWISIRPAGLATQFRLGEAYTGAIPSVAAR